MKKVLPLPELLHHLLSSEIKHRCRSSHPPSHTPNLTLEKCEVKNLGTLPELLHHLTFPNFDGSNVHSFVLNIKLGG